MMTHREPAPKKVAASCPTCLAWGVLYGGYCRACYDFRRRHRSGRCAGCGRDVPLKNDYCRLCWLQAGMLADAPHIVTATDLAKVTCHQLAFAGMTRMRGPRSGVRQRAHLRSQATAPGTDLMPPMPRPADGGQLQLHLSGPGRAFDWALHAELANPVLLRVRRSADQLGQAHGWNPTLVAELDRALVILLSGHAEDEQFRYSQLVDILHRYGISIDRVAEVLDQAELLVNDRVPMFQHWLNDKLAELAPSIATDVRGWVHTLQHGGPRNQPRKMGTIRRYVRAIHPILVDWSARYAHLREVTTRDVTIVIETLQGWRRCQAINGLRSLMRHCKKTGTIFANPAARIQGSKNHDDPIILPLTPEQIDDATQAATTPAAQLALVLAAVHAARPETIRMLRLNDTDLANRRLTIATVTRPLDELTHRLLRDWLTYRRDRWPNTANPYLIINKQTASTTRPVSDNALTDPFRRQAATLEALRVDRQLDEALAHQPDPLHLAAVFGLDETTAIRYSAAARNLLHSQHHNTPD